MEIAIAVGLCGALGCLSRYYLSGWVYAILGRGFPYGTFVVNIVGAFIIALLMEFGLRSTLIPTTLLVGLTIGFLGGLNTFSTCSYETFRLLEEGDFITVSANVIL